MLRSSWLAPRRFHNRAAGDRHLHQPQRAAVAVGKDRLGPALVDNARPARTDLVQRLGPGDALPLAAPLRAGSPQGIEQSGGMIDVIEVGPHLGAEPAARDGVVRIAAKADGPAVNDLGEYAAGVGTIVRTSAANGQWRHGRSCQGGRLRGSASRLAILSPVRRERKACGASHSPRSGGVDLLDQVHALDHLQASRGRRVNWR